MGIPIEAIKVKTKKLNKCLRREIQEMQQKISFLKTSQPICMSVCLCSPFSNPPQFLLYLFSQPITVPAVPAICALVIYSLLSVAD